MNSISNSSFVQLLRYQARLIWQINLWLAPFVGLLMPFAMYLPDAPDQERLFWVFKWGENFLPLLGIAICANLFSQEIENQTAELWLARSISRPKLVLSRVFVVCVYIVLVILIPSFIQYFTYVRFHWGEMMLGVLPPIFFLGLLGMMIGILTKNSAIAFLAALIYWFFEMTTKGKYTGVFFLFSRTSNAVACAEFFEGCSSTPPSFNWIISKFLVAGLCIGLVIISILLLDTSTRGLNLRRFSFHKVA